MIYTFDCKECGQECKMISNGYLGPDPHPNLCANCWRDQENGMRLELPDQEIPRMTEQEMLESIG